MSVPASREPRHGGRWETVRKLFRTSRRLPGSLQKPGESGTQKPEDLAVRLPLRWGLILLASGLAAVVVYSVAGPAAAIGTGIAVAVGLDRMLA
jgi:hypothetical protein